MGDAEKWGKDDHDRLVRMEEQLSGLKTYVEARLKSIEDNTEMAAASLEKRLDSMNEFRMQLKDQAATMMPRAEFEIQHNKACEDIKSLRESRAETTGKATQSSVNIAYAIGVAGIIMAVVGIVAGIFGG